MRPGLRGDGSAAERVLDAALECTFPASDPIAVQSAFEAACQREAEQQCEISTG